ncbi:hypothetical protein CCHL11_05201 [Colletotrichum chlorophyti]|uniref:Uncharacterized protein n=1 Tax=Colletotrichum chlorophyti TaxID=708187 RepID=A0A1Q8RNZ9_9PEZI|nr:hypothetical protein CCHL11_05201 [Colletotrichum chlorophyti]
MDPAYNYGFNRAATNSSLAPETPTSYKTNVKRTKTKKWVEAKTQNYDGDDWGNDFDDEPDEPAPVPPLRPMGSRQASRSSTSTLPSAQYPDPVPSTRPLQPNNSESGFPSSPRAIAGLPPLTIQTQSHPPPALVQPSSSGVKPLIVSGPSSKDSASEKAPYEQLVSPQSATNGPTYGTVPAMLAGRQDHPSVGTSPVGDRQSSPAPAQPHATRFPPRKSSMTQQDRDRQSSSNSRSSSTQPPWLDQRSASPGNVRSSGTPPTSRSPPPVIRPADIYRRLEDDKDKERSSVESGRPSLDSTAGRSRTDRSVSPANPPLSIAEADEHASQINVGNPGNEEGAPETTRTALEPVAERRSGYGVDSLLSPSQNRGPGWELGQVRYVSTGIAQENILAPQPQTQSQPQPQPQNSSQLQSSVGVVSEQPRRYSTSPRLPDLARMSLFGDDFFSNSSTTAQDAPPMPSMKPQHEAASTVGNHLTSVDQATTTAAPVEVTSPRSAASLAPQATESLPGPAPEQSDRTVSPSPTRTPLDNNATESSRSDLPSQSSRPSLPGAWVTETQSIADVQASPAVVQKRASLGLDAGEVSPISDNDDDNLRGGGVATVNDRVSIPVSIPETSDQATQIKDYADQGSRRADADLDATAPSVTRNADESPSDFVAPEKLQRESTFSTVTDSSPVKESDKLREEIMRSLSPVRPTSDPNDFNHSRTPGSAGIDDATRESTYLHGVYDDYWAAGDDKPEVPDLPSKQREQGSALTVNKHVSNVPPLSPRKEPSDQVPVIGRRFSWEAELEQVTPGLSDIRRAPVAEAQAQPGSTNEASSPSAHDHQLSLSTHKDGAGAGESAEPATVQDDAHNGAQQNTVAVSHQVSQVTSMPKDGSGGAVVEPHSHVSVTTDKNDASAAPNRRLSLAEEKSMPRVSSNPISPSPPPGDHPALAQASEVTPSPASPAPSQQQPAQPLKVATFKEIMELHNSSDRIDKFNETRAQFASMDSGLNDWLINLKSQHPEHANATAVFGVDAPGPGQPQQSPTGSQPASQQPYYQQYLNASSPNVSTAAASGRPPAGSAPAGSHSPSSDFKHSSGQVGAKGKELLLAAGKAGKGLLSKGKSKLRGTGDKVFL